MLTMPFYVACAHQTMRDLKIVYEEAPAFGPILFMYSSPIELRAEPMPVLRMAALVDYDQREWPKVIREMVSESGSNVWGLATEVAMRFHGRHAQSSDSGQRTEHWLVYLLCHDGGMLAWGAPVEDGRKLGTVRELTDDPRLQKMLAHLSEASLGDPN